MSDDLSFDDLIPQDTPLHADYRDLASKYGARISSMDRTPEHNAEVGGVPNSQHVRHTAMDAVVPLQSQADFIADAQSRGYMTINEGDHIHVQLPHGGGGGGAIKQDVSFDDLVPKQTQPSAATDVSFDDLIPKAPSVVVAPAPSGHWGGDVRAPVWQPDSAPTPAWASNAPTETPSLSDILANVQSLHPVQLARAILQGGARGIGSLSEGTANLLDKSGDVLGPIGPASADALRNVAGGANALGEAGGPETTMVGRVAGYGGQAAPALAGALAAPELELPGLTAKAAPTLAKIPGLMPLVQRVAANLLRSGVLTGEQAVQDPNATPESMASSGATNVLTFGLPGALPITNPVAKALSGGAIGVGINEGVSRLQGEAPTTESDIFATLQGILGGAMHAPDSPSFLDATKASQNSASAAPPTAPLPSARTGATEAVSPSAIPAETVAAAPSRPSATVPLQESPHVEVHEPVATPQPSDAGTGQTGAPSEPGQPGAATHAVTGRATDAAASTAVPEEVGAQHIAKAASDATGVSIAPEDAPHAAALVARGEAEAAAGTTPEELTTKASAIAQEVQDAQSRSTTENPDEVVPRGPQGAVDQRDSQPPDAGAQPVAGEVGGTARVGEAAATGQEPGIVGTQSSAEGAVAEVAQPIGFQHALPFIEGVNARIDSGYGGKPIAEADHGPAADLHDIARAAFESGAKLADVMPADTETPEAHAERVSGMIDPAQEAEHGADLVTAESHRAGSAQAVSEGRAAPVHPSPDATGAVSSEGRAAEEEKTVTPAGETTSTKDRMMQSQREALGEQPLSVVDMGKKVDNLAAAREKIAADPNLPLETVARIRGGDNRVSPEDETILQAHVRQLTNDMEANAKKLADPNATPEAKETARKAYDDAAQKFLGAGEAIKRTAASWSATGRTKAAELLKDFTFAALVRKKSRSLERTLKPEELTQLREQADHIADLEKQLEEARQKGADAEARAALEHATKQVTLEMAAAIKGKSPSVIKKIGDSIHARAEASRKALTEAEGVPSKKGQSGAVMDPRLLTHYANIGADHLFLKFSKFADWAVRMTKDLGERFSKLTDPDQRTIYSKAIDIIREDAKKGAVLSPADIAKSVEPGELTHKSVADVVRAHIQAGLHGEDALMAATHKTLADAGHDLNERDVRRMFSEYGEATFPSKDALKVEMRELRSLTQMQESIDRLQEGLAALKSGPQRDKATQAVREKRTQLDDLLKKQIANTSTASPEKLTDYQEMRRNNLTHQIEDLQKQIDTGERPQRTPAPELDARNKALVEQRDALRKQRDAIDAKPQAPDASEILRLERQIKNFDRAGAQPLSKADTQRVAELKDRLQAMYDARDAFNKGEPKSSDQKRIDALKTRLKNIQDGKQSLPPEQRTVTPEEHDLKEQIRIAEMNRTPAPAPTRPVDPNAAVTKRLQKRLSDVQARLAASDFAPRPKATPRPLSDENQKIAYQLQKAKNDFVDAQMRDEFAKQGIAQKTGNWLLGLQRLMIFSHITTFGKLASAATQRIVFDPVDDLAGSLLNAIPGYKKAVSGGAPTEGQGFSLGAYATGLSHVFSRENARNMLRAVVDGQTTLDVLHGVHKGPSQYPYLDWAARLHGAIKTPVKLDAFYVSMSKQMAFERDRLLSQGVSPDEAERILSKPENQATMQAKAIAKGKRAILMQDNAFSDGFQRAMHWLGSTNDLGKATEFLTRALMPVVKIPSNFITEVGSYTGGGLAAGKKLIQSAMKDGIANMTPEERDYVARNFKKQTVGLALLALGYLGQESGVQAGGYYDKRHKPKDGEPDFGGLSLWGHELPHWLVHSPQLELLQIGATLRRYHDSLNSKDTSGHAAGVIAGGIADQVPLLSAESNLHYASESPKAAGTFAGREVASFVEPGFVQDIAKWTDDAKTRKPQGFVDAMKLGIPGLREQVPRQ